MNKLPNIPFDVCVLIIEKLPPIDLQYLRSTCSQIRKLLDEKIIDKLHTKLETTLYQLKCEIKKAIVECQIKEKVLDEEVGAEIEELKNKAKLDDIKSGLYNEELHGEYEFTLYDDEIDEEILNPFDYLKRKKECKYKIKLLEETLNFWISDLEKIKLKIEQSQCVLSQHQQKPTSGYEKNQKNENLNYESTSFFDDELCSICKSECVTPHLEFNMLGRTNYCYYCVLNNKKDFIFQLLKPSKQQELYTYGINYNALRIMSGMGGLSYSN